MASSADGYTVAEVARLLGISESAVHQRRLPHAGDERGAKFEVDPVVTAHREKVAQLREKLQLMRQAAATVGLEPPVQVSRTAQRASSPQPLDNDSMTNLEALREEVATLRSDGALKQQDIDRLKLEIRRARKMIDGLQATVTAARPVADFLDNVDDMAENARTGGQ